MTRKDYKLIADTISGRRELIERDHDSLGKTVAGNARKAILRAELKALEDLTMKLALNFGHENERFDRVAFWTCCGFKG